MQFRAVPIILASLLVVNHARAGETDAPAVVAEPSASPPAAPAVVRDAPEEPVAEASAFTPSFETLVASTYVFRGVPQYAGRGVPSSQSTASVAVTHVGPGDVSFTAWNATALAAPARQPTTSLEVDLTAQYSSKLVSHLSGNGGYTAYLYPRAHVPDGAHEVFQGLALNDQFVVPSVTVYEELVRLHGAYASGALAKTLTFGSIEVGPQLSAGVSGYRGMSTSLNDVTLAASVKWNASKVVYVAVRGSESYMARPASELPNGDGSAAARFVPCGGLAFGLTP